MLAATNFSRGAGSQPGTAVRAFAGHGADSQLRVFNPGPESGLLYAVPAGFGAGEFAGGFGVIGAATADVYTSTEYDARWCGAGVLGIGPQDASGYGVVGTASTGQSPGIGVLGTGAVGVFADATGTGVEAFGSSFGVEASGATGVAATSSSTGGYGVHAAQGSGLAAVVAQGDVQVQGTLSKSGGSFRIDHPDDPANRYLSHSFVESPDMMNVYNGIVTLDGHGSATVTMPSWFEGLNRDFRYQLTPLGRGAPDLHVAAEMVGGSFAIGGGRAGQRVSWQVTGVRQDAWARANRIPVESDKPAAFRGTYLHPELFDQPVQRREGYREPVGAPSRR